MNWPMSTVIVLFATAGVAYAVSSKWETHSCEYLDIKKELSFSGRCHKKHTEINGNFAYILTWPSGNKVTVEYVDSQSGNHIWKINRQPAAAVEVDRENLKGFSLDLNQILEWQDNP